MATAAAAQRRDVKEFTFIWEGVDRANRQVRGELRAASRPVVHDATFAGQGIRVLKIKRQAFRGGPQGHREGHHVLHAPARHDAEGGRPACCRRSRSLRAGTATRASRAS
jgi:hypothetical protein